MKKVVLKFRGDNGGLPLHKVSDWQITTVGNVAILTVKTENKERYFPLDTLASWTVSDE